ncbi:MULTISPECIES: DUF4834 domain-containing protein [Flavobacteriaceae]|uniref:DUF4834 domain-containing protein n=2 Tax=Flavobacteriaceae TaxID=49546 RepID=A0A4Y8AYN9_9FLAO|nr:MULTISPECIES: DUF4834 domain-containing protein [Flavobacteriaceae]TEW77105.1 DUF4834 domain-containing protein [Gramella jeungdoensis]GGK57826.1 hypothetical protein GCM10007963_27530 [Lutibacter litoralis]
MGLLKTIAILVIIYYAFKFFSRYIAPIFLKKVIDNVEKKYKEQQQNHQQKEDGKVGETVIAKKPVGPKESNKDVGDYVDYEEVKDDR